MNRMDYRKIATAPIKFYQRAISPAKPPCCKYYPTCSNYAIGAIKEWGIVRGIGMGTWRILRCNPFSKGGYDPVPLNKKHHPEAEAPEKEDSAGDQ